MCGHLPQLCSEMASLRDESRRWSSPPGGQCADRRWQPHGVRQRQPAAIRAHRGSCFRWTLLCGGSSPPGSDALLAALCFCVAAASRTLHTPRALRSGADLCAPATCQQCCICLLCVRRCASSLGLKGERVRGCLALWQWRTQLVHAPSHARVQCESVAYSAMDYSQMDSHLASGPRPEAFTDRTWCCCRSLCVAHFPEHPPTTRLAPPWTPRPHLLRHS